ncbi:MAG: helix-turn-helix domain-containing protein, partial [Candidatus Levybacteria bacterium]|nr:helix-turn-helix domain-containing protein [Candidatus Levybacteria bacterium]
MYKRLPAKDKLVLIKRVKSGEKVSKICKEAGISRTIFYKWFKDYKNSAPRAKKTILLSKVAKGRGHWKKLNFLTEQRILKIALKNNSFSAQEIAKLVGISAHGVWNTLKKNDLNTKSKRILYIERNGVSLINPKPVSDKITMIRRFEQGENISNICRDFSVSRTIFYRWLKRYQKAAEDKKREVLESLRPKGEKHWRFIPGAKELVLQIVVEHPEYSSKKISNAISLKPGKMFVGNHGVYNLLRRLNLNTYQRRIAFANEKIQTSIVASTQKTSDFKIPSFVSFSFISVIPPPLRRKIISSFKVFIPSFISTVFLIFLIKVVLSTGSIGSSIGILFSLVSFVFGMFFFLYSFKYYITIAAVLSFSRQKDEEGGRNESFFSKLFARVTNRNKGEYSSLTSNRQRMGIGGLQSDLSRITLDRNPFVSIHLSTYNDKRVINWLLTAATSMDYENYEVIVADDSTDETIDILKQWEKHPRVKIIHRENREGYKGGALKEALKQTD